MELDVQEKQHEWTLRWRGGAEWMARKRTPRTCPGLDSLMCHLTSHTTSPPPTPSKKGSRLGWMLCSPYLAIFNNLIFELVFCKWHPWDNRAWHEQRYMWYACPLYLAALFTFVLPDARGHRIPVDPQCRGIHGKCVTYDWGSWGSTDSLQSPYLLFEQEGRKEAMAL